MTLLRDAADALEQAEACLSSLRAALLLIIEKRCENFTGPETWNCINSVRTKDAGATVNRWCDSCIAAEALGLTALSAPAPQEDRAAPTKGSD